MRYTISYFAPYNFANFTCTADTLAEARQKRDQYNRENGFSIPNREIKEEKFRKGKTKAVAIPQWDRMRDTVEEIKKSNGHR